MSKPTKKSNRPTVTGIDSSGPVPVEYRFAHARNDNRHLVVVFANYTAPQEYGWSTGTLDQVRANILWIRDLFDGANSYYLCKGMDFSLEQSVAAVIHRVMNSLGLTPEQVTMFGSSKGGTAAMFFGLKYGFGNVVSSVPMLRVGTSARARVPAAAKLMMGEVNDENTAIIDRVLPDTIRNGNRSTNIYLLSSPNDEHFAEQLEPYLPLFQGYPNFNFIYNVSPLITRHPEVTLRCLPFMVGLLHQLVEGVTPRFGSATTRPEEPGRDKSGIEGYLKQTSLINDSVPQPMVTYPEANARVPAAGLVLSGVAPGAVRVSLWENGKHIGSAPVAGDGTWRWQPERQMSIGRHAIRLFSADGANRQSTRAEVVFTAMKEVFETVTQPGQAAGQQLTLTVTTPGPHQQLPGPVVNFVGFAPGAVRVDFQEAGVGLGSCAVRPDGSWIWEPGWAWHDGPHSVEAIAVDAVGNYSAWVSVPFTTLGPPAGPQGGGHAPSHGYGVPAQNGGFFDARM
ncbi:hypothetical protein [Streptomyces sp. NPDC012888]|uniref:hypothetical protein n=1 Tax=Streptomyces sp. NPDC012888 TaxID=3364855 RepID=UPI003682F176